jgi:lipopolysaccharide export system protein LptA
MATPVSRLRHWFAAGAVLMIAIVAGMYFYARWRLSGVVHEVPAKLGLDIQQTAEGFSISKSEQGRTIFTVSASKAVQFKEGGRAELHNVKITVYGKDSNRFDRISGEDFEFDPKSGDVIAQGKVLIDLEANPEGAKSSDQTPPAEDRNPIHLETDGLIFNKDSGDASASGKVIFQTPQATGSAVGAKYVSKTGTMTLNSAIEVLVISPQSLRLNAERGVISKSPSQVMLDAVRLVRQNQQVRAKQATFFLRPDDTVDRIFAEGEVEGEVHGNSTVRARSDQAELLLTGSRNQLTTAVMSGNVHMTSEGKQPAEGDAGRVTLHFGANQVLEKVHAEEGVRLLQNKSEADNQNSSGGTTKPTPAGSSKPQQVEMSAPAMDFIVKDGRQLEFAETSGPPQIVITQPAIKQKTVVTAGKFTAKFTAKNRIGALHGEPDAKIVGTTPGQPDRVSTSPTLDVMFLPEGGISTITQAGGLVYESGTQKAWAQQGTYTDADQMLSLGGAPRVVDNGMTTTAQTIRFNRTTGDAIADGDVKSTYSDLKPDPNGALLASSDPIHVVSRTMTAHRSPAIAVYSGNARLWQNANIVEAPTLQFDRDHRTLVAEGSSSQRVKTVLVQLDKGGKATPVTINSAHLTYNDGERTIFLQGGVTATGADTKITSQQMTVYLVAPGQEQSASKANRPTNPAGTPGQVEKIVAENNVVILEPTRRGTGDRLMYTAADDKFVLTGGPPSIFDAERGKITGDSLTFFRHDDRVLVEGRDTSPAVTRTQVAR